MLMERGIEMINCYKEVKKAVISIVLSHCLTYIGSLGHVILQTRHFLFCLLSSQFGNDMKTRQVLRQQ